MRERPFPVACPCVINGSMMSNAVPLYAHPVFAGSLLALALLCNACGGSPAEFGLDAATPDAATRDADAYQDAEPDRAVSDASTDSSPRDSAPPDADAGPDAPEDGGTYTPPLVGTGHPNIFVNQPEIDAIRVKLAASAEPWQSAYAELLRSADDALTQAPVSVTFGGLNRCGGQDIFCSTGFYDDGRGRDRYDADQVRIVSTAVRDLGMAYAFSGQARYATKAIELIRVWALNPDTRMRPVVPYQQAKVELYPTLSGFIYGADLIWNYPGWLPEDRAALSMWIRAFGEAAMAQTTDVNNFGNWKVALVAVAGAYLDDAPLLEHAFSEYRRLIPDQVHWTGRMNQEASRTAGWGGLGYSLYAIQAMAMAAEVARHRGVDLYDYTSDDGGGHAARGRGLRVAMDFLAPFLVDPSTWPPSGASAGPTPLHEQSGQGVYELAYSRWRDPGHLAVLSRWGRPLTMNIWALGSVTLTHANHFDLGL